MQHKVRFIFYRFDLISFYISNWKLFTIYLYFLPTHLKVVNRRKSSNPHITRGRHKFRLYQILLNAAALLIIAGVYFYFIAFVAIVYHIDNFLCRRSWSIFQIFPFNYVRKSNNNKSAKYFKFNVIIKYNNETTANSTTNCNLQKWFGIMYVDARKQTMSFV